MATCWWACHHHATSQAHAPGWVMTLLAVIAGVGLWLLIRGTGRRRG